jgi:hypothetical protein
MSSMMDNSLSLTQTPGMMADPVKSPVKNSDNDS